MILKIKFGKKAVRLKKDCKYNVTTYSSKAGPNVYNNLNIEHVKLIKRDLRERNRKLKFWRYSQFWSIDVEEIKNNL